MNFDQLLQNVVGDTIGPSGSLWAFRPEMTLCMTIIAVLLAKIILPGWKSSAYYITLLGLLTAGYLAFPWEGIPAAKTIFTGVLIADSFTVVVRGLLLGFAILFAAFTQMTGVWDRDDQTEFYVLMLGALVGMCLMISANHVLVVMLGVEMAST